MRCEQFSRRLDELLDERRRPLGDRRLRAHAKECRDCRDLLDAQMELSKVVPFLPRAEPPLGFADRTVTVASRERARLRRWRHGMVGAVAAAVLVAVVPMARYVNRPAETTEPVAARRSVVKPRQIAPRAVPTEKQSAEPYVRFAHGVGETVASGIVYVPGLGPGPDRRFDESLPEPFSTGLRPFRPLGNSMAAAVDAIRQTLPLFPESAASRS
jgi:predicted anti-sigma-YlaC factor YlaD